MRVWEATYKGHVVRVENGWFTGERLLVERQLQDECIGFDFRSRLFGTIKAGDGAGERIKVSLGGWFGVGCRLFIEDAPVVMSRVPRG